MLMSKFLAIECKAFREEDGLQPLLRERIRADSGHAFTNGPRHHHLRCFKGPLPRAPGRAGVAYLGSSEIGYSLRVDVCRAPDRAPRCRCGSRSSSSTEG